MLLHYLVQFCAPPDTTYKKLQFLIKHPKSLITGKKLIRMEGVSDEFIESIAKDTDNFSGRELFKMVVAWHDAAFMKPDPILTPEIMQKIHEKFKA